jgi:CRP-like cAMP-binding protein
MERLDLTADDSSALTHALKKVEFFAHLTMGDFERFSAFVQLYGYRAGETVFRRGAPGDALFVVRSGELHVTVKKFFFLPAVRVGVLKENDLFGETALIDRSPRTATVTAVTDAKLFVIQSDDFDRAVESNAAFRELVKRLSSQRKFYSRSRAS